VNNELYFTYNDSSLSGEYNTGVQFEDGKWAHTYDYNTKELRVHANGVLVYSSDYSIDTSKLGYVGVNAISSSGLLRVKEMTYTGAVTDSQTLNLITT
jgi:hypothetical protein